MRSIVIVQLKTLCECATVVKSKTKTRAEPSITLERSVLEAIDLRRFVAGIVVVMVVVMRVLVFGYAAAAVGRWDETVEAVADDAFAPLARDVGDVGDGGAVPALGRVSGEGNHAATTCNLQNVTLSEICIKHIKQAGDRKIYNSQLSRSRAVLTHSHALGLLP